VLFTASYLIFDAIRPHCRSLGVRREQVRGRSPTFSHEGWLICFCFSPSDPEHVSNRGQSNHARECDACDSRGSFLCTRGLISIRVDCLSWPNPLLGSLEWPRQQRVPSHVLQILLALRLDVFGPSSFPHRSAVQSSQDIHPPWPPDWF
jgi:hypothetical protein